METVNDVLNDAVSKIGKSFDALKQQFAGLRTGKASPAMVDQIRVDYYGAPTPIKNLGTISTPEPRMLIIALWDTKMISAVEKPFRNPILESTPRMTEK